MKCLRTLRRHWICFIFVFSFFLFLSVFGLSQDSYATSYNCSMSFDATANTALSISDFCSGYDGSFSRIYVTDFSGSFTLLNTVASPRINFAFCQSSSTGSCANVYYFDLNPGSDSVGTQYSFNFPGISFISYNNTPIYLRIYRYYHYEFTFTISDSFSCPVCEECQVCPVIPENPYDDKFDALTKAIYCCGAILIMLYFFFCIYKIIVKDGGSR